MGPLIKMLRFLLATLMALALLILIYASILSYLSVSSGISKDVMDWDNNGSVDLREFLMSADVGQRKKRVLEKECVEYFSLKDGLELKTVCQPEARN